MSAVQSQVDYGIPEPANPVVTLTGMLMYFKEKGSEVCNHVV